MKYPRIYADFHNADHVGRLRLNSVGTLEDLATQRVQLHSDLELLLYTEDADAEGHPQELQVRGTVEYSEDEHCWVARIDWNAIQRVNLAPVGGSLSIAPEIASAHSRT